MNLPENHESIVGSVNQHSLEEEYLKIHSSRAKKGLQWLLSK